MTRFLVSGLVNIETTLRVDGFPIPYHPSLFPFFGINNTVSGVGYNVAKALTILGSQVDFHSFVGADFFGRLVKETVAHSGISSHRIMESQAETAQSIIAYDSTGKRIIFTDLKDAQEQAYPEKEARNALKECDIAVLCNINYSRPLLALAKEIGKPIATDVHTIAALDDPYNQDFMAAADILFMSDENLPVKAEDWIQTLSQRYRNEIIVVGQGRKGALLYSQAAGRPKMVAAVQVRPVVNTIGAGDSLFSAFLHFYGQGRDPVDALEHAVIFAGHKVGENGAAEGFLPEQAVLEIAEAIRANNRS